MSATRAEKLERPTRGPSVPDILLEHLEEFGFLSLQRRKLIFSDEVELGAVLRHDRRIAAHWAGLGVAPRETGTLAEARLPEATSSWDVMACVRGLVEWGEPEPAKIREWLSAADEDQARGWREALRRTPPKLLTKILPFETTVGLSPLAESIAVDAYTFHDLLSPKKLSGFVESANSYARRAVARHLAFRREATGVHEFLSTLSDDNDPLVRRLALWGRTILEPDRALEKLTRFRERFPEDPFGTLALSFLAAPTERTEDQADYPGRRRNAGPELRPGGENPDQHQGSGSSMLQLWRRALRGGPDPLGLRREVPDGFFDGQLSDEALPGE